MINVKFLFERNSKTQYMKHYFELKQPKISSMNDEDQFEIEFDRVVERTKEEREAWSKKGCFFSV